MTILFQAGMSNAIIATVLALLVMLLTLKSRQPAWTHALWVLVLLKLVTPSLVWFNFELPQLASNELSPIPRVVDQPITIGSEMGMIGQVQVPVEASSEGPLVAQEKMTSTGVLGTVPWTTIMLSLWVAGAVFATVRYSLQWMKIRRWVHRGTTASKSVDSMVVQVASRIGLRRVPQVAMVQKVVTPSVFALGFRSTLVLPESLLARVTDDELETIIAHELVHLHRGDGWVGLIEMLSAALFWWHPIVPWVRRKIHQAAEEACDAWVTSVFPDAAQAYASAMLKTVDFLSAEKCQSMPLMTGMGDVASLSRRMRRISGTPVSPALSWRGRTALVVIATALLPLGLLTIPESVAQQPSAEVADPFGGGTVDPFGKGTTIQPQPAVPAIPLQVTKPIAVKDIDPSGVEAALRKGMSQKVTIEAMDEPLANVLASLKQDFGVPLFVDSQSLEELGMTPDIPVTISLKNVSLRSALRLMLRPFDLTYMIKDEVIQITTSEAAEYSLTLRAYALPAVLKDKMEKVASALTASVSPDIWEELGGPCSLSMIDNVIVVSGTEDVHAEVDEFIKKVETAFIRRIEADAKAKPKSTGN
ncbi:M56 family metallopeptidase [Neorhodopirellula pilleata]|uniref:Methicillin resistance mecR1 protein n=1 Tax=Neorhodopirellula pilleata TaxID=2714738 RepID=A0A5C5YU98_9BACT|nr:M56 family metallopeptidase [Neorhodopirellula pilleata]TWT78589.1 Methicillin resistance mecR1 protein [Neorhodopirellula pilleata]